MATVLKVNALNPLPKGSVVFRKGDPIRCIGILMKGSIKMTGGGIHRIAEKGAMIAVADLFCGSYLCDYTVEEDAVLYPFSVNDSGRLEEFLSSNADYRGIVVHSMAVELSDYLKERESLLQFASQIQEQFVHGAKEPLEEAYKLQCRDDMVANYKEYAKVLLDIHKKYFYNSKTMAYYQTGEITEVIKEVLRSSESIAKYLDEIYLEEADEHLFEAGAVVDAAFIKEKFSSMIKAREEAEKKRRQTTVKVENLGEALKNSLQQILKFARTEGDDKKELMSVMEEFVNAKDRLSTQDDMRKIKKKLTTHFFKIYEKCIFLWLEDENVPLPVELFLNYGYMDERLLDEPQIQFLYEMMTAPQENLPCRIYTIPEWLKEIYKGKKEPSRNSFEQDYRDWLREEKRTGNITEQREKELLEDYEKRVSFEINNMFVSNHKIVNGKLSTYVPVLYKDEIYGHLERMYLTKERLCEAIVELEKLDFTIFQREVLYTNPELNIEKEYVLKHVYPDVILAPVYGMAVSMWQEITGKKRDTPGRFIFPVIAETEVDKLVTKAFGRFHWEYCRCEQGAAWNNIQYKSLTSEYMDYIQYYKKNRELTEEKREKIKAQVLKARNNSREIFLIDYETWIYYESKAALKLNKVSRLILAAYCPFNRETRDKLKTNAAFEEALMKHQRNFGEKKREWEMRIKRRENKNLEVPKEFYDTYNYYANN